MSPVTVHLLVEVPIEGFLSNDISGYLITDGLKVILYYMVSVCFCRQKRKRYAIH